MKHEIDDALKLKVMSHLSVIYPHENIDVLASKLIHLMRLDEDIIKANSHGNRWNETMFG